MRNPSLSMPGSSLRPQRACGSALQVALPMSLALVLAITFVALLIVQARKSDPAPAVKEIAARPVQPRRIAPTPDIPGNASARDPFEKPSEPAPRHAGRYPRWNLREFPEGWDEKIAQTLHSYFEELTYNPDRPVDMNRIEEAREGIRDFLLSLGAEAMPTLAAILNAEGDFVNRRMVLKTIGELGPQSPEATFVLRDFFVARHKDLQNRSEMLHVVDAMGTLKNNTGFDVLQDLVHRGKSEPSYHQYREKLFEALGEHPRRVEAAPTMIEAMHEDVLPGARNKAAQALGKLDDPSVLPDLYNAIEKERAYYVKQTMLGSVGKIGDPESLPFLESQARLAKESAVRLSAANAIRRIGTRRGEQLLREVARDEQDPELKKRLDVWVEELAKGK